MWRVITLGLVALSAAQSLEQNPANGFGHAPDRYCLACLCQAATGCNLNTGCEQAGGQTICGPFYMSRPFWQDASTHVPQRYRGYEFPRCATDRDCAAETVAAYMTKFSRDCDGDGRVTCRDHGLMHYLGYTACASPATRRTAEDSTFFRAFMQCLTDVDGLLVAGMGPHRGPDCQNQS